MSHNYLLDTYQRVEERLEECRRNLESTPADSQDWYYWKGRLDALKAFYDFVFETFHRRLPRRLMQRNGPIEFPPVVQPASVDNNPADALG